MITNDNPQGDLFRDTCDWFVKAGQQPAMPEFNAQQVCFYLGMQLEELAEKLSLIFGSADAFVCSLNTSADEFKRATEYTQAIVTRAVKRNPALWLDADLDLIWVSLGGVRALGVEPSAAYALVADANWAKFPDGVVTRDANGKVMKPPGWREADLTPVLPAVLRPTPKECGANGGQGCSLRPCGPNGEMMCQYCGGGAE